MDWKFELAHISKVNEEAKGPALLYQNVKGDKTPAFISAFTTPARKAIALEQDPSLTLVQLSRKRMELNTKKNVAPKLVNNPPVMENIIEATINEAFFAGYRADPKTLLSKTFDEACDYDDIVVLRDIRIESHCEHHIMPILGRVHVAYRPAGRVVGISKLARVVEIFAKRLQNQESLTTPIADCINDALAPHGVAVVVEAVHLCMTTRGIEKHEVNTITRRLLGAFQEDAALRREFLTMIFAARANAR